MLYSLGKVFSRKRARLTVAIASTLALMLPGMASAGYTDVAGPVAGDGGHKPAMFYAEIKLNSKGRPTLVTFIEFNFLDYDCTSPTKPPFIAEVSVTTFPSAKVTKQNGKYTWATSEGTTDSISGTISKNVKKVRGSGVLQTANDDYPTYVCNAEVSFTAKSVFSTG